MELGDRIRVTLSGRNGIAFVNFDAVRRLHEVGIRRKGTRGIRRSRRSEVQMDFLRSYVPQIRDLAHYRELVGDERAEGPMVWFDAGATLLMELTEHPKNKRPWYVVLDTAIAAKPEFLQELAAQKSITITTEPSNDLKGEQ